MRKQLDLFTTQPDHAGDTQPLTLTPTIKMPDSWKVGDRVQVKATLEVGKIGVIMSDRWLAFVEFEHRTGFYYPHSELINLEEHPPEVREQAQEASPPEVREQAQDTGDVVNWIPNSGYVEIKQIKGRSYRYLRWRENGVLKSRYLGRDHQV